MALRNLFRKIKVVIPKGWEGEDLTPEENRQMIARRLRGVADNIEHGRVTPDSFNFNAEWIGQTPTGRVFLTLTFWTRPIQ